MSFSKMLKYTGNMVPVIVKHICSSDQLQLYVFVFFFLLKCILFSPPFSHSITSLSIISWLYYFGRSLNVTSVQLFSHVIHFKYHCRLKLHTEWVWSPLYSTVWNNCSVFIEKRIIISCVPVLSSWRS